ncbi:hypothetical protein H8959_008044 [Pygathrix nigripes]
MEDFATRTYGTSGLDNRPLFGETSAKVSADCGSKLGSLLFYMPGNDKIATTQWKLAVSELPFLRTSRKNKSPVPVLLLTDQWTGISGCGAQALVFLEGPRDAGA